MQSLKNIGIPEKKAQQLIKAGITDADTLARFWPRKYSDRSHITGLMPDEKNESIFVMRVNYVNVKYYSRTVVDATGYELATNRKIKVVWFNQGYLYDKYKPLAKQDVLVCGKVTTVPATDHYEGYLQVVAPTIFERYNPQALRIYPTYKKIKGMSEEYLMRCISQAIVGVMPVKDTIPENICNRLELMPYVRMMMELHWPTTCEALEAAQRRHRFDDLLYFATRIELNHRHTAAGSAFGLPMIRMMNAVKENLPFTLTEDQAYTIDSCIRSIRSGKRLNALVQGDVGCGKTIVAVLMMIAFAENGYQAALMAPTQILAKQHYDYLKSLTEPYGLRVAFVSGKKLKAKEQRQLEADIAAGEYDLIVGTQALLSATYQFKNLAFIVEDEEHKYGVLQRKQLIDKAEQGTHIMTMSATPIPRTLAQAIHGDSLEIFCIRSKPSGRQPVQTGIAASMDKVFHYICHQVLKCGHQAYVVCPMIDANEKVEGVASANEVYEIYQKALGAFGIKIALVTGKTKKAEAEEILCAFERNEYHVLVSTTVIEVGVNVPNATAIIIHNAERFGLAQLHQLRGRVGRGSSPSACVLVSEERDNERLIALCTTTDGFKIAEMDLQLRGAGNLIGIEQSGSEKYLSMALTYPEEYRTAQELAKELLDTGNECEIIARAIADFQAFEAGE